MAIRFHNENAQVTFDNGMTVSFTETRLPDGPSRISLAVLDSDGGFITNRFMTCGDGEVHSFATARDVATVMNTVRDISDREG